jgi:hypothetical protein
MSTGREIIGHRSLEESKGGISRETLGWAARER